MYRIGHREYHPKTPSNRELWKQVQAGLLLSPPDLSQVPKDFLSYLVRYGALRFESD